MSDREWARARVAAVRCAHCNVLIMEGDET